MKLKLFFAIFSIVIISFSCSTNTVVDNRDTPIKGTIYISVDESFKPVIEEQIKMYMATYTNTKIIASYKSEADCFRDLQKDSTRLIIVSRGLNKEEQAFYFNKLQLQPQFSILAFDAVAILVNKTNKDSIFSINRLQNILSGKENISAVMDGNNATSTVKYLSDSILKGMPFGSNVVAAKNSQDLLNVIAENPTSIGFIGLNWISDKYDKQLQKQMQNLTLGLVECVRCQEKGLVAKPSQAAISYAQYPLARGLYYIVKENTSGLGTGFANFMSIERGQLIFRRSFLVPAKMNFTKRRTTIGNNSNQQ